MEQKQGPLPFRPGLHEKSAAAYPFLREGKLAGCLLAISNQADYFLTERLSILEVYANLLALSFRDDEFYELRRIALHEMPILSQQEEYTSLIQFRERVRRVRREHEYRLPEVEAELLVLRDMEAELLRVHAEK